MPLLNCAIYIAAIGLASHLIGPLLPKSWFCADRFPFRSFSWEHGGSIYLKLRIRAWKDRVPDMSKITRRLYRKEVDLRPNAENLTRLIQETCLAESVHAVLIVLSLAVTRIWRGVWGWLIWFLCILGNLPFMIIQRFNRPRLQHSLAHLQRHKAE